MTRTIVIALALVLTAPALTGCVGLGDDSASDDGLETKSRAQVSEERGGIEGVVTDEAVQPVEEATVSLVELGETTQTADDGSFAFSEITPGAYTLEITADGFLGTERQIETSAGAVTTIEVVLAHEATVEPFSQQFEFKGFLECSVRAVIGVAVCAIPNNVFENATNDRFLFTHRIEANPWQMVSEMQWAPDQPLAERMSLIVEPEGIANDNDVTFAEVEAASPIIMTTDRQRFFEVEENLTATCEAEDDATGSNDAYCNRNYVEEGGSLQLRVFVEGINEVTVPDHPCPAEVPCLGGSYNTVGLAIQQDFTIFQTVFYNTPACEDYSIIEDNRCEQQETPPETDPYNGTANGS